ncbi:FmdB family zinc ribbon protein [Cerasicoccus maritimus]|uniref:FmdB family zinc ribbon protein n=1 Tax=Cerasicoccus maritimus TaxID=490089 RepID=UPI00285281C5|nr:FmdB family zinc ribbon protein [Cerasicoccus maritimus]
MPTYDYHCAACDTEFEHFQSMKDDPLSDCPLCNKKGKVKRQISSGAGIIFKGSGFYETDYKKKSGSKSSDSPKSDSKKETKSESKKSDAKKD